MIIKSTEELKKFVECGEIANKALKAGLDALKPGVCTLEINDICHKIITKYNAIPSFLNYDNSDGVYPFATCVCINSELVHATPKKDKIVKVGDIVTIDLGVFYKGIHTDLAYTVEIESNKESFFLNAGRKALKNALSQAITGKRVGDISYEMQHTTQSYGFNVSYDLVGHGIGKELHEAPQIPCYGKKNTGATLIEGQVVAIEVMYMKGDSEIELGNDGFAYKTADNSLSAQFEHTVVIRKDDKPLIVA